MRDHAARTRTGLVSSSSTRSNQADLRIHVTLDHLKSMEGHVRSFRLLPSKQPSSSVLNGRHASRLRGRGLNFEELRGYLPGDDPRTIDWKVTARTGEPHVRVYSEERDRPTLVVVDQRMSMFFGTRHAMKSVTAAEAAALIVFRVLDQGDRIGGIVFGDELLSEVRPRNSRNACHRLLCALERANRMLKADAPSGHGPMGLNQPLSMVARIAKRDHLVVILSDFDGIDDRTEKLVAGIARRNDVILCPITDPISQEIPNDLKIVVSDGELQVELDTTHGDVRKRLETFSKGRLADLLHWQKRFGLIVLPLSAGEETLSQLRLLTGGAPQKRRPDL
ncbi:hypothetical protein FIV00_17225 [Labrenzia sp. THAF82]|uniref:DUF58 domain-containing protein n=1 Tax=Labrenzia sp. THAF82 TaxID=2587861 RepID=UPI001268857B|nr:DUF58 domain-containing protein [Labrenzia sp. THAF82]QFT32236.1 hypothetical protein FIV00_17225 [Labrenzia sp. THAF82]